MQKDIFKALPAAAAVLLIAAMAAVSELTGEKEILFPEIAAIAAGSLISPRLCWNTNDLRLLLTIAAGSVTGLLIVQLIPLPLAVQMCMAFLLSSLMLVFSGTTFAPLISSIVLPVMLQTKSFLYPVSAVILTTAIIMLRRTFCHFGLSEVSTFTPEPLPDKIVITDMLIRWLTGSIVMIIAVSTGCKLIVAPPLLVAFTEFWKPGSKARKSPVLVCSVITACAVTGTVTRYLSAMLGIYEFIAVAATTVIVFIIMKKTAAFIPPAAALSVLAFLIPSEQLAVYPLFILTGVSAFTAIPLLYTKLTAQNKDQP